jgi:hypothetical protein
LRGRLITTDDIILHIFYLVAPSLPVIPRYGFASQSKLYPSELLTIGILFASKGGYFRTFYRWLDREAGSPGTASYIVPEAERVGGQACHFGSFPQLLPTFSSNLYRQSREIP